MGYGLAAVDEASRKRREPRNDVSRAQENGAKLIDEFMQKGYSRNELDRMKESSMDEGWESFVRKLASSVLQTTVSSQLEPDKTPAALTIATAGATLMRMTGLATGTARRKAKDSDAIDLLHTVYLPFVDVFRADGFMARVIRDAHLPFSTAIVGNISELLSTIENVLAVRSV